MHVLIIDDNRVNLMYAESVVAQIPEAIPICFESALPALDWIEQTLPDLLIVDFMMPDMDGMEVIRTFRRLPHCADIPLVMVTAVDARKVRHQALDLGATDFLTKPIDPIELRARVSNLLALRRTQRALADRAAWLADEVERATAEIANRELEVILRLCRAAEYRDGDTGAHVVRVGHFARLIARNLGLNRHAQNLLFQAAPMHDIGKLGIPDAILLKPGRLTSDERQVMETHTTIGQTILDRSRAELLQVAGEIALSHHERYDGTGYPGGLTGEAIPLFGRIVSVADVFDALMARRPYKQPWPAERVYQFLRDGRGAQFDPACVDALFSTLDEFEETRLRYQFADPLVDLDLAHLPSVQ